MKRKSNAICLLLMLVVTACAGRKEYNDGYIKYGPLEISQTDKEILPLIPQHYSLTLFISA